MSDLIVHRPKSIEEALELLKSGKPLAGGTRLTPGRREESELVDLQELGLDPLDIDPERIRLGSMLRLQELVEAEGGIPSALKKACRLEAGLNLRNMATVGGSVVSADGRSPLLTVLLAMQALLQFAANEEEQTLDDFLNDRRPGRLILSLELPNPEALAYEQVARSPADLPIVCACAARYSDQTCVSLGGYGPRPIMVASGEPAARAGDQSSTAYAEAGDQWASAEYRREVAGLLISRVLEEVAG